MKVTIRNFNLNNIEVKQLNKGVVSIQFYNVGGFEKDIKLILGRDLNGDKYDDRICYPALEVVSQNNVAVDENNIFRIQSIKYDDEDSLFYYDDLFDFVTDSVKRYFEKGYNKFISAIINKVIYDNLMKGEFMA